MKIKIQEIKDSIICHNIIKEAELAHKGHVRFETVFKYPDGSNIDVFLNKNSNEKSLCLTDFGTTIGMLLDLQLKPWLSPNKKKFTDDILETLELKLNGSSIEKSVSSINEIESGIISVAQGCLRFSDLIFTRRSSIQNNFSDIIEDFFADSSLDYEENIDLGDLKNSIKVDYLIKAQRKKYDSAILTLSTGNSATAHSMSNEIFRKWYDLKSLGRMQDRITIFNDEFDVYKEEDLKRLRDFSTVLPISDKDSILSLVA